MADHEAAEPVLDSSALLAYLGNEPGAAIVSDAIAGGSSISTVNLGEVLSLLATRRKAPADVASELTDRGLLGGAITVEPFTIADAIEAARLRPLTRSAGLSTGDRACLALARRLSTSVVTGDVAWTQLTIDVEVRMIRDPAR